MNIEFENSALEELYTNGKTHDHQYKRLSKDVVKQYIKVVNYIKAVKGISGTGHLIHIRDWLFDPTYHLSCPRDSPVENLASTLIVHEWYGHGVLNYGTHRKIWNIFPAPNHHVVYDLVRKHSLYNKTTEKYKAFVNNNFNYYLENEWSELWKSIK